MIVSTAPVHDRPTRSTRWPTGWPRRRRSPSRHGLRFGYHNHDTELHCVDGRPGPRPPGRSRSATPSTSRSTSSGSRRRGRPAAVIERLGSGWCRSTSRTASTCRATAYAAIRSSTCPRRGHRGPGRRPSWPPRRQPSVEWLIAEFDHVDGLGDRCRPAQPRPPDRAGSRARSRLVTAGPTARGSDRRLRRRHQPLPPGLAPLPEHRAGGLCRPGRGERRGPVGLGAASRR